MDPKYATDVFFQILSKWNDERECWNELWLKIHKYLCVAFLLLIFLLMFWRGTYSSLRCFWPHGVVQAGLQLIGTSVFKELRTQV